jgi:hypothetical protein
MDKVVFMINTMECYTMDNGSSIKKMGKGFQVPQKFIIYMMGVIKMILNVVLDN